MQVMNNSSSMMALGELKKNESTLGKQLKKVSSGLKINGAGDGAWECKIVCVKGLYKSTLVLAY